jgi:hypothetical protein
MICNLSNNVSFYALSRLVIVHHHVVYKMYDSPFNEMDLIPIGKLYRVYYYYNHYTNWQHIDCQVLIRALVVYYFPSTVHWRRCERNYSLLFTTMRDLDLYNIANRIIINVNYPNIATRIVCNTSRINGLR